jgi:hypothetical protein
VHLTSLCGYFTQEPGSKSIGCDKRFVQVNVADVVTRKPSMSHSFTLTPIFYRPHYRSTGLFLSRAAWCHGNVLSDLVNELAVATATRFRALQLLRQQLMSWARVG